MTRTAAVIGGGIGGLTVAGLLKQNGWTTEIFERSGALPDRGSALGMWPDAMTVLETLGIADRVRTDGHVQDSAEIRDHRGRLLSAIPSNGETVMISRVALLHALADAAAPISFSSPVDDPATLPHDVVICADGINSASRQIVAPHAGDPRSLDVSVVIAQFPGETGMFTEFWGPRASFGITPLSADRCDWHAAYRSPAADTADAELEHADPLAFVAKRYVDWTSDVAAAIASTTTDTVLRYHVRRMPRFRTLHRGRAVLIGDAVHAMAPNLGRGACETILDAASLAASLRALESTDLAHVDSAFAHYTHARRRRAYRIATASRLMCRAGMLDRTAPLRNTIMRLGPG